MYIVSNTVYIVICKEVNYKLWQTGTTTLQSCCQFITINLKDIGSACKKEKKKKQTMFDNLCKWLVYLQYFFTCGYNQCLSVY